MEFRSATIVTVMLFLVVCLFVNSTILKSPLMAASPDRDKAVEGGKREGQLVLYTGMDTEEANLYTKEFSKKYPFIKADVFRSSGEKVQARFLVVRSAGEICLRGSRRLCGWIQGSAGSLDRLLSDSLCHRLQHAARSVEGCADELRRSFAAEMEGTDRPGD